MLTDDPAGEDVKRSTRSAGEAQACRGVYNVDARNLHGMHVVVFPDGFAIDMQAGNGRGKIHIQDAGIRQVDIQPEIAALLNPSHGDFRAPQRDFLSQIKRLLRIQRDVDLRSNDDVLLPGI